MITFVSSFFNDEAVDFAEDLYAKASADGQAILYPLPENGQHPCRQYRIADVLVAEHRAGKKVIVFTHSMYVIEAVIQHVRDKALLARDVNFYVSGRSLHSSQSEGFQEIFLRYAPDGVGFSQPWPYGYLRSFAPGPPDTISKMVFRNMLVNAGLCRELSGSDVKRIHGSIMSALFALGFREETDHDVISEVVYKVYHGDCIPLEWDAEPLFRRRA